MAFTPTADAPAPGTNPVHDLLMQKWAGQPTNSGLGGSMNTPSPQDDKYDPMAKPKTFTEIGASGLAQYGGFVRDEFLPQLQGDNALHVYREMFDNDPIVGALVFAIQMLLRKVEWRVEPPEAATVEDIVEERMQERMSALRERQQAAQQRLLNQQAGLAGNATSPRSPGGVQGGGKQPVPMPPPMPKPALSQGIAPGPLHAPSSSIPARNPGDVTSQSTAGLGVTDPNSLGPNPRSADTLPGTNSPSLTGIPDKAGTNPATDPGTNPSGSPAQAAALAGNPGFGPGMDVAERKKKGNPRTPIQNALDALNPFHKAGPPNEARDAQGQWTADAAFAAGAAAKAIPKKNTTENRSTRLAAHQKALAGYTAMARQAIAAKDVDAATAWLEMVKDHFDAMAKLQDMMSKASGSATNVGEINSTDPDFGPVDPETMQTPEFAVGTGPEDITPEARKALELAVFVETCFHDLDQAWSDVLAQIITMIVYGWAFHEIVYKKRNGPNPDYPEQGSRFSDGRVGWAKIAGRAQETRHRWEFDDHGAILGMWQLAPPKFQLRYLPLAKGLLFRTTTYKNNPEGRSCLRPAYRPWYFKKRIEEFEAIGVERDLGGLPVAYVPAEMMSPSATQEEQAALREIQKIVRNLKVNEQMGVVFPMEYDPETNQPLYKLELLASTGAEAKVDTDKIIQRYEQRIAMTTLADFILLGHDAVGARSLGETKADLFTTALEAWLQVIADVFNTYAIPRLLQINGEDPAMCPKLTFGKMETISLEELSAIITSLSAAGADLFPDTQLEDYIRDKAGMPPKASSDDL